MIVYSFLIENVARHKYPYLPKHWLRRIISCARRALFIGTTRSWQQTGMPDTPYPRLSGSLAALLKYRKYAAQGGAIIKAVTSRHPPIGMLHVFHSSTIFIITFLCAYPDISKMPCQGSLAHQFSSISALGSGIVCLLPPGSGQYFFQMFFGRRITASQRIIPLTVRSIKSPPDSPLLFDIQRMTPSRSLLWRRALQEGLPAWPAFLARLMTEYFSSVLQ